MLAQSTYQMNTFMFTFRMMLQVYLLFIHFIFELILI